MIIPKFIYKQIIEMKKRRAFMKGYNAALSDLKIHFEFCQGVNKDFDYVLDEINSRFFKFIADPEDDEEKRK